MPRQKCEVYSRVVGFLTPVSQWNRGKKEEFKDRRTYDRVLEEDHETEKSHGSLF
ncbi:MAG: hypothetical protein PWR10_200 [Halanaerobiales bacterium]|nr:hypothetical protein [Halanaerobiales bacterium]